MDDLIKLIFWIVIVGGMAIYNIFFKDKAKAAKAGKAQPDKLKELLNGMGIGEEEEQEEPIPIKKAPPPLTTATRKSTRVSRTVKDSFSYQSQVDNYQQFIERQRMHINLEEPNLGIQIGGHVVSPDMEMEDHSTAYDIVKEVESSTARDLVNSFSDKKRMILVHEILSPPKGFRKP